jgi:hypothetical protein
MTARLAVASFPLSSVVERVRVLPSTGSLSMPVDPFSVFRATLERRARWLHRWLAEPHADLPGILFVETDCGETLLAGRHRLEGLTESEKDELARITLPATVRARRGRRAGWLMPAWRPEGPPAECLALVVAEPGEAQAVIAQVARSPLSAPVLGHWSAPTVDVSGLFVDPLLCAVEDAASRREGAPDRPPPRLLAACPDCGAAISEAHERRCDIERCSHCGEQWLLCQCPEHNPLLEIWTGQWPGADTCRALGWYAVWRGRSGWRPCSPMTAGAIEDVNRLAVYLESGRDCLYD